MEVKTRADWQLIKRGQVTQPGWLLPAGWMRQRGNCGVDNLTQCIKRLLYSSTLPLPHSLELRATPPSGLWKSFSCNKAKISTWNCTSCQNIVFQGVPHGRLVSIEGAVGLWGFGCVAGSRLSVFALNQLHKWIAHLSTRTKRKEAIKQTMPLEYGPWLACVACGMQQQEYQTQLTQGA